MTQSDRDLDALTRRAFVTTGAGYALAALPITAWAIQTPAANLEASSTTVPTGKEALPVYVARPKKDGQHPVVVVIHEIFGVHEYIKDVCRRLANEGYVALAPDLFFRHGDATKIQDFDKLRKDIVSKATQQQVLNDIDALLAWLDGQKFADSKRIGLTGFCWGGNVTWMYAAHNPRLKAGVAWYGRLAGETTPAQPRFPVDVASQLKVPVLGLYGEKDQGIPLSQVESMRTALAKGKSGSKIIIYKDAGHGFHADYRPMYDEKSAKEAWGELLTWFKAHGV